MSFVCPQDILETNNCLLSIIYHYIRIITRNRATLGERERERDRETERKGERQRKKERERVRLRERHRLRNDINFYYSQ